MRRCSSTIYLGPMPGSQEPLESWLKAIDEHGIDIVVCLTHPHEISEKSPDYAAWRAGQTGPDGKAYPVLPTGTASPADTRRVELVDLPIGDNQAPGDADSFWEAAAYAAEQSDQGRRVFIHCRGGRGRTGLFAVALLLQQGHTLASALRSVQEAGSSPQAEVQREFLQQAASSRLSH